MKIEPVVERRERPGVLSMSASGACTVQRWREWHNEEPTNPHSGRQSRTLTWGHYVETATVDWLKQSGWATAYTSAEHQLEVTSPHAVGHLDGLFQHPELGEDWYPFDVKGLQTGWARVKANQLAGFEGWVYSLGLRARDIMDFEVVRYPHEGGVKQVEPHYYDQAQKYMHHGRELDDVNSKMKVNWDRFFFLVVDKGTLKIVLEEIAYDPAHAKMLDEREEMLYNLGTSGEQPDIPEGFTANSFPCSWSGGLYGCVYRDKCWGHEGG